MSAFTLSFWLLTAVWLNTMASWSLISSLEAFWASLIDFLCYSECLCHPGFVFQKKLWLQEAELPGKPPDEEKPSESVQTTFSKNTKSRKSKLNFGKKRTLENRSERDSNRGRQRSVSHWKNLSLYCPWPDLKVRIGPLTWQLSGAKENWVGKEESYCRRLSV